MINLKHLLIVLLMSGLLQNITAQNSTDGNSNDSALINELVGQLHFIEGRLVSLAEAMPEEKYNWRPEEGVRSVGEVFNHAGGANYFLLSYLGNKMPEGFSPDYEKSFTDKSEIIDKMKEAYQDAMNFISSVKTENLYKEVELPFGKFTQLGVLLIVVTHGHEHLGQSIAYARMNGVTPPWSNTEN